MMQGKIQSILFIAHKIDATSKRKTNQTNENFLPKKYYPEKLSSQRTWITLLCVCVCLWMTVWVCVRIFALKENNIGLYLLSSSSMAMMNGN